jgi:hypothetical protein
MNNNSSNHPTMMPDGIIVVNDGVGFSIVVAIEKS